MGANMNIAPMGVTGVQHLIERAYREGGELQFIREFYKNAEEAGATRIEFGPEWQGVENSGVYRLMVADNGRGMTPEQIETFLNTFGGGGKPIGDAHENFGIGAKTSALPWNHRGLVVISWTEGYPGGSMVWLCRDPATGEYGARQFRTEDGDYEIVVGLSYDDELGIDWRKVKPDWLSDSGTVVVCLGDIGNEDTFVTKGGDDKPFGVREISSYLNRRIWEIPISVELYVQELRSSKKEDWPRSLEEARGPQSNSGPDRRWNRRRILGAEYYVLYPDRNDGKLASTGTIMLGDGTEIDWYLWEGDRPRIDSYAHDKGYIAALYSNEIYDIKKHHGSFRRFGIASSAVREKLTLIARPPRLDNGYGVYPDSARNSLKIKGTRRAGEPLPWDEWGEEFSNRLPSEIIDALRAASPSIEGTLQDEKWKDRLNERFGSRWRRRILKMNRNGQNAVDPERGGSTVRERGGVPNPRPKPRPKPLPETPGTKGGTTGVQPGAESASLLEVPGGVPNYRWVSQSEMEEGVAAVWQKPNSAEPAGLVLLNKEFNPFVEVIRYWQDQYGDLYHERIETIVRQVYGESMVARIAHSESLQKDPRWGKKKVEDELRNPSALTMSVLGLVSEDAVLAFRIPGLLSVKKKSDVLMSDK